MNTNDKSAIASRVCSALSAGDVAFAQEIARTEYPFNPATKGKRSMKRERMLQVFIRDGFIDRYFGGRLLFPGVLYLLRHELPAEFPAPPSWRASESHFIYWELWPMVDHIIPIAQGGTNELSNLCTTSVIHNDQKGHYSLDLLGWALKDPGNMEDWDGLIHWFIEYVSSHPQISDKDVLGWHQVATKVMK
ncbi:MAG: hypothetical protein SH850_15345 [Planctomycetaceae bacterium]|nr:hypothetical protein [Planctomycetaceae bacterium]